MNWYEKNIEKPVRQLVKLLRENGFNTECSCGHKMYVQCQYTTDGEIKRLDNFLFDNGYRNYEIQIFLTRINGNIYSHLDIKIMENLNEKL